MRSLFPLKKKLIGNVPFLAKIRTFCGISSLLTDHISVKRSIRQFIFKKYWTRYMLTYLLANF